MNRNINDMTLEELEEEYWDDPGETTKLIRTCFELRKKPLKDFNAEDLRIMIGQRIGLEYLIPIAVNLLNENPYVQATFYPGDLLLYVLNNVSQQYWEEHEDLYYEIDSIVDEYKHLFEVLNPAINSFRPYSPK